MRPIIRGANGDAAGNDRPGAPIKSIISIRHFQALGLANYAECSAMGLMTHAANLAVILLAFLSRPFIQRRKSSPREVLGLMPFGRTDTAAISSR
jgi:hypothetical protein